MSRTVMGWLVVLFVFSGAMTCWTAWRLYRGDLGAAAGSERDSDIHATSAAKALEPLDDFTLTDQQGKPFHSRDLRGKVWIASFFYTSCPSVCRMQNMQVADLQRDYEGSDVHFVSVTCDPETDTPSVLANYAAMFSANPQRWHFVTGDFDYIERLGPKMQTTVKKEVHSDRLFVLDRQGHVRGSFRANESSQIVELKRLVDRLRDEPPTQLAEGSAGEDEVESGRVEVEATAAVDTASGTGG